MALYCALSNKVPEVPVVSPLSGAVFERQIIERYIEENGVDPLTGQELHVNDLIEIKTQPTENPRPPSPSMPSTSNNLPAEWDALMLHTFTQQEQLQTSLQGKMSRKNKTVKVDARILRFSVTATEDRLHVGDINTV